jgi:transcriptional regulator with XRE-family HTH domain
MKKSRLVSQLKDKAYRDAFVAAELSTLIPIQIRALRKQKAWSQKRLGTEAGGMKQGVISKAENTTDPNFTLDTLKRLAAAFDVALVVRFVAFSELTRWALTNTAEDWTPPAFMEDRGFSSAEVDEHVVFQNRAIVVSIGHPELATPRWPMSEPASELTTALRSGKLGVFNVTPTKYREIVQKEGVQ